MREKAKKAINLTKFFGFNVSWKQIIFLLFLYPLFLGLVLGFISNSILQNVVSFLALFSVPSLFISLLAKLIFRKASLKQFFLAGGIGGFIYSTLFFISALLFYIFGIGAVPAFVLIGGLIASLMWYFVGVVFFKSQAKSIIFSFLQFIIYSFLLAPLTYKDLLSLNPKLIISLSLFIVGIYGLYYLVSLPVKRNFGFSVLRIMQMFFSQWFFKENELEKALTKFSKKFRGNLELIRFKIKNNGKKSNEFFIVIPPIHYGPFGKLGSSDFPSSLKRKLNNAISLHSLTNHDMNLASSFQKEKLISEVISLAFSKRTSKEKAKNFSFFKFSNKNAKAFFLIFDRNALVFLTREPNTTEDVEYTLGLLIKEKLSKKFDKVFVADMHNSEGKDVTYFNIFSKEGKEYLSLAQSFLDSKFELEKLEKVPLKTSYFHLMPNNSSIGGAGIFGVWFDWKEPILLIIVDGNSVSKKGKAMLEKKLSSLTKNILIITTDTHEVNLKRGVVNEYTPTEEEINLLFKKASEALESLKNSNSTAEFLEKEVELRVLGKDFYVEVLSTFNNSYEMARALMPLAIILFLLLSLYIVWVYV